MNEKDIKFLKKNQIEIENFAKSHYKQDDLHGIGHVLRVLRLAQYIHQYEGGKKEILESMVWLHDIGRKYEMEQKQNHALISVKMAQDYLSKIGISIEIIEYITKGIYAHSYSLGKLKPESIEAQILSDADKIDAIGAVGIFRACVYQSDKPQGIKLMLTHFDEKLIRLQDLLILETSKNLGKIRTERITRFKKEIQEEVFDHF